MKHLFYAFYVSFYAAAMFVAGLFFGQFMERRWTARERAESAVEEPHASPERLVLDEAPVGVSTRGKLPTTR